MEKLLDNEEPERAWLRVQKILLVPACWTWWVTSCWLSYSPGKSCSTAKAAAKVRRSSLMSRKQYSPVTVSNLSQSCYCSSKAAVEGEVAWESKHQGNSPDLV